MNNIDIQIERLENKNKRLAKRNEELRETNKKLEKKIKTAISYSEYDEFKESCGRITEKLDNTAEYEDWLIVQEYFGSIIKEIKIDEVSDR